MKALVAFLILSSLYFKVDKQPLYFSVNQETFNKCKFSNEIPCIKVDGRPIRLIFGKRDEYDTIQTSPDSLFGGFKVIILKRDGDAPMDSVCPRSDLGSLCFIIKQNTMVLLPPEMGLESEPVTRDGYRELILMPNMGSPNEGDVELFQ